MFDKDWYNASWNIHWNIIFHSLSCWEGKTSWQRTPSTLELQSRYCLHSSWFLLSNTHECLLSWCLLSNPHEWKTYLSKKGFQLSMTMGWVWGGPLNLYSACFFQNYSAEKISTGISSVLCVACRVSTYPGQIRWDWCWMQKERGNCENYKKRMLKDNHKAHVCQKENIETEINVKMVQLCSYAGRV